MQRWCRSWARTWRDQTSTASYPSVMTSLVLRCEGLRRLLARHTATVPDKIIPPSSTRFAGVRQGERIYDCLRDAMAAPSHITLEHLSGTWKLNMNLSDSIEPILAAQGVNTLLRKAISSASVTLFVSQPERDRYEIKQKATAAGIPGTTEEYILDWEWRENHDAFFGQVKGMSHATNREACRDISLCRGR